MEIQGPMNIAAIYAYQSTMLDFGRILSCSQ
jgi:hypothetical protein